jgi:hypothetical protein
MPAFGEVPVVDQQGNVQSGIAVDLIDPATGIRIADTVFTDMALSVPATLPLITDSTGRAQFWLTSGKTLIARVTIGTATFDDYVNVVDPAAASVGGGGGIPTHTHVETDVTNLPADLSQKAPIIHTHVEADVTNLPVDIAGKAATVHTHAEADISNLTPDLAAKLNATGGTANHPLVSDYADLTDQGADPASPSAGRHRFYSKAGGLFVKDSTGTIVGALGTGGGAGGANAPYEYAPFFVAPATGDYVKERSNVTTSVTSVGAIRTGGTGTTVDIQKNGTSILSSTISLTTTAWTAGTLIANPTTFAAGDILQVVLAGVSGGPTDVLVEVYGTRLTT